MIKERLPESRRLGAVIRKRRCALGLTQEKLAERIERHETYVGMVERGQYNISLATYVRFAKALGTTIESLARSAHI